MLVAVDEGVSGPVVLVRHRHQARLDRRAPLNRWILGEASKAVAETSEAIEAFRFNDAANAVYRFVWSVLCDWCLELSKPVLQGDAPDAEQGTGDGSRWTERSQPRPW